jgi:hypothetical protein
MKKLIFFVTVFFLGFSTAVLSQEPVKQDKDKQTVEKKKNGPVAEFDKTVCDLGELTQNVPGTAVFTVFNKGNEPLIFSSVTASCGCTNLQWSQEPLLPGKSTTISATYNAAAAGNFLKTITVKSNATDQPVVLQLKGKVNPKQN